MKKWKFKNWFKNILLFILTLVLLLAIATIDSEGIIFIIDILAIPISLLLINLVVEH